MNIRKIYHGFAKITDIWCVVLMALMTVTVIVGVFLRYVFSITFVWYEESITMLFLAISFFGMVVALRENENIRITYFFDKLPKSAQSVVEFLMHMLIVAVEVMVIVMSFEWIKMTGDVLTPGLRWPYSFFYSMVPISAAMMAFEEMLKMICQVQKVRERSKEPRHNSSASVSS